MTMLKYFRFEIPICVTCLVIGALLLFTGGCDNSKAGNGNSQASNNETLQIPKLDFHKPKNLNLAVNRLREIHSAVISEQPIPEPREFDVVEVIHGQGSNAHSHFYLAESDYKKLSDHGHEDTYTAEKRHQVEVDVFSEFQDIANWLPRIAAATDGMQPETWSSVNKISSEIGKVLIGLEIDLQDVNRVRNSFRENNQLDGLIKQLESATDDGDKTKVRESS